MLTPEQAQAELKKLESKDWVERCRTTVEQLPTGTREVARSFLGLEPSPYLLPLEERAARGQRLVSTVMGMDQEARLKLFETLLPGHGRAVEETWKLMQRLPYQSGWVRKPFRAPRHSDALIGRRIEVVERLVSIVGPYRQNIVWFAEWAGHIAQYGTGSSLGLLFAAAIDAGGPEGDRIFDILVASAKGEHPVGVMGTHVIRALLSASRPDGWEFIEKMLLAAQREEGLRQSILECIDEAHPQAFRRMLWLILDHDLARFSATVRAFDTWLGYRWDSVSSGVVNATIEKLALYLDDATARESAVKGKDAEQAYLALWCQAFEDGPAAIPLAVGLLKHSKPEHRFVAVHLLDQLQLVEGHRHLVPVLADPEIRVAWKAMGTFRSTGGEPIAEAGLFEHLEALIPRLPEKRAILKPMVWPWTGFTVDRQTAADLLPAHLGQLLPQRLIPHLDHMSVGGRTSVVRCLQDQEKWDTATRDTLFALVGDSSKQVRESALLGLALCKITATEAQSMEKLLERKSGDLRRGVLTLLALQPDPEALASADRLLDSKSQPQRHAGIELLREMVEEKRSVSQARERVERYRSKHPVLSESEAHQLDAVLKGEAEAPSLDNALGLISHDDRTWPAAPRARPVVFHTPAARKIVEAVDALFVEHAQRLVTFKQSDGETKTCLLSEFGYGIPHPDADIAPEEDRGHLPMADVWEEWWTRRGPELRDKDGLELLRAIAWYDFAFKPYGGCADMVKKFPEATKLQFGEVDAEERDRSDRWKTRTLLSWMLRLHPPEGAFTFAFTAAETALAMVPADLLALTEQELRALEAASATFDTATGYGAKDAPDGLKKLSIKRAWRDHESPHAIWLTLVAELRHLCPQLEKTEHSVWNWRLRRWMDEPVRPRESGGGADSPPAARCLPRDRADGFCLLKALAAGAATEADLIEQMIGARESGGYHRTSFSEFGEHTRRKARPVFAPFKFLPAIVDKCRRRVLEIELARGDNPTVASDAAMAISSVWGIDVLMNILRALGKGQFTRGWARDGSSRETVFSHLVRCSFPLADETREDFKAKAAKAGVSPERLVELAVYAPQWAAFVEHALGWESLTEAVWWIHAHTKGDDWTVDAEIRELWKADLASRTALSSADLLEGAVDVAWFLRIHDALGDKRWTQLYDAAKFASTGAGHARARLFADAMLGETTKKELVLRVTQKRHQDALRALGLLPLAKARDKDLLDRYKVIQEFRRGSKQFGSQRQASEKRAAQIAQQNLARTAGFADPIRLEWAMEAKAVEDLADGPIEVVVDGVKVSLGIDPWGEIDWSISRDGKALSDIPPKLKKDPKIVALRERKVELKRQASCIRPSLEQFMVRAEKFTGAELQELMEHPLLAPMLANLVLVGEQLAGYPIKGGKALEDHSGKLEVLKPSDVIRIAHPHDLLPAKEWHRWQKDCFARERIQPFKQVFRELYPLTDAEKKEGIQSRRYAGHQVQPRQALALLGNRGWVNHPEEGVRKIFHDAGIAVHLGFQETFFTPAEVEGLTLESLFFSSRKDHTRIKLTELDPILFSETMRDLDLVVSVAHRGGVDPEASASTVEMRSALVEETCRLLKLGNVRLKDRYALIKGALGEYSVHLGSAVTRKMPGETLFIVAVHSQHRGRLFLPFADDDPRTAEVMSKVLLLARDKEIKDPTILDQIRSR